MKARTIHLYAGQQRRNDVKGHGAYRGSISWSERKGLIWKLNDRRLERDLRQAVKARIRSGRYYVAAAVRIGQRVSGMEFDRIRGEVPEVLRCLCADASLWRRRGMRQRILPVFSEGSRDSA